MKIVTGIKPTGSPHLGNYLGAIRPALEYSKDHTAIPYFFIADYHALISTKDPKQLLDWTRQVAATWLSFGLDPNKVVFYKQSDVPELFELSWILSCVTPKGLMNRAHAYKAAKSDEGVNLGLYTYPILMTADILAFQADLVPVAPERSLSGT